jgi:ethanolamine utilization protein EutA
VTSIEGKEVVYRSPIYFTPIKDGVWIDFEAIKAYVEQAFGTCGIQKEEISTGAVIITGETARKENAARVAEQLSDYLGSFVVATAGPKLEALLAGYGAKAQELSKERNCRILNLDIGGGTANNVLFDCGEATMTYALDIGGRLLRVNEKNQVIYLSERINHILQEENLSIMLYEKVKEE